MGIKEILEHFLDFRILTTERRFQYQLAQLQARIHILEGFVTIFDALDETIKIIRASDGKADAAGGQQLQLHRRPGMDHQVRTYNRDYELTLK